MTFKGTFNSNRVGNRTQFKKYGESKYGSNKYGHPAIYLKKGAKYGESKYGSAEYRPN